MAVAVEQAPGLPLRARALLATVVAAGAAAVVLQLVRHAASFTARDLAALLAVALAVAAADQFTLTLPHGGETEHFALTDGVWIAALVLTSPGVPTLAAVVGGAACQLSRRWAVHKVAFNMASVAIGLSLAEGIYGAFGRPDDGDPASWALAALAMLVCFLVNASTVAAIIAFVQDEPFHRVLLGPWRVNLAHWLGNVSVGLLAAVVWQVSPAGSVLLAIPAVLLYLAYQGWLLSTLERDEMQAMAQAADAIARDPRASGRLPVGEREGRLPALAVTLNRMLDQLERSSRRERHVMREMSEELRRPGHEIGAALDRLDGQHDAAAVEALRVRIRSQLARTSRLLDEMDAVAGAASPGFVQPQEVEAATLLAEVVADAQPLLGARLRATPPPCGTVARVDPAHLRQALLRLLANAAVHGYDAPVDLRVVEDLDSYRFEVEDEGSGLPAGHEEAVFEPFHRADGGAGAGLGLAYVRTVAEAHGGTAGVDNRPGRGATFWVRVPR